MYFPESTQKSNTQEKFVILEGQFASLEILKMKIFQTLLIFWDIQVELISIENQTELIHFVWPGVQQDLEIMKLFPWKTINF